jgi:hypothetical protein
MSGLTWILVAGGVDAQHSRVFPEVASRTHHDPPRSDHAWMRLK